MLLNENKYEELHKMVVNVAVLGCGMVGKIIPPVLRQAGQEISAVFGETQAEAEGLVKLLHLEGRGIITGRVVKAKLGEKGCNELDYETALKENIVPIDVVYNGLPNFLHAGPNIAAAKAGKHVFSEKPLAPTIGEVLAMQNAIIENNVLFEVDSAYSDHELPERIRREIAEGKRGKVTWAEDWYDQKWQKEEDAQVSWRPIIKMAGKGKLIPDLGFHTIYTLKKLTGGLVVAIDAKAWNVHPIRQILNKERLRNYLAEQLRKPASEIDLSNPDTFGSSPAPRYSQRPDLYDPMEMLGPLPPGVNLESILPGKDPRLFTGEYSGDDIAQADLIVSKGDYTFPVQMRVTQVTKGENDFGIKIICEDGSYEWFEPHPDEMEIEGKEIEDVTKIYRGSSPGIFTLPKRHPAGYTTAVGLKTEPFFERVERAKVGRLTDEDKQANREILRRAVRTQFVLDKWLQLGPGYQEIKYEGVA